MANLKNYTSMANPLKTAAEIEATLITNGAKSIQKDCAGGKIIAFDNACQTEIKEADMAFCDIRHKCEIDYPKNRSTRTKICRLMKEYSVRRRNAKETLEVITPLVRFLDKNTHASNLIGQMANETRKALENTRRSKVYKARVLPELFEGMER